MSGAKKPGTTPTTRLSTHTDDALFYRDTSLTEELIGKASFTEAMIAHILGRPPSKADVAIIDAVLITLMEHGLTPSAIATRLTYHSAPEALQAAMAAGLLNVGSQFVGTMENASKNLREIVAAEDGPDAAAERIVTACRAERRPLPGFGHHLHRPDDPRTPKLFAVARDHGVGGTYIDALETMGRVVDRVLGKHLTINATGAVAAVLLEIDVPPEIMRGFAVISRAAGLLAHIAEEREDPTARFIWDLVEHEIPYAGNADVTRDGDTD